MNTLTTFKQKKAAQGFTLIELMIAIAIVGVLAAVAVPQFTDYLGRARVSEAVNLAQGCKTGFVEFNATQGAFPATAAAAGCQTVATQNVTGIAVTGAADPRIIVTLAGAGSPVPPAVQGHLLILQPLDAVGAKSTTGGVIASWRCSVTPAGGGAALQPALNMVPNNCRQTPLP